MRHLRSINDYLVVGIIMISWFCAAPLWGQLTDKLPDDPSSVMTAAEWKVVDRSIERALEWLTSQQKPDGSFPTIQNGQPGVTSLCLMAFLSQGHLPNEGKYGKQLQRALDYIVSCQNQNGILAASVPDSPTLSRIIDHQIGYTSVYNHALAGLVLTECYAMAGPKIEPVIKKALDVTFQIQDFPRTKSDAGGWRYLDKRDSLDSDLSTAGWQLMFLRSARDAGFDVEEPRITRAVGYVRRCFLEKHGTFTYSVGSQQRASRGMAGAGILALAHAGLHETPEAQRAGDWILKSGFDDYNQIGKVKNLRNRKDRYFYGLLTCSQAMYQLGGRHWREFFPPTARVLVENQRADGSWAKESYAGDSKFGNAYTTATAVIALSPSNQLLPIFQR